MRLKDNLEIQNIIDGMFLKSYRFDKYKTTIKKNYIKSIKIVDNTKNFNKSFKDNVISSKRVKGVFLTRDLVSEPANILYPSKFVEICNVLKKSGVIIDVLDEKKMKSLGMI